MERQQKKKEERNKAKVLYSNHVMCVRAFYSLHWNFVCICLNGRISSACGHAHKLHKQCAAGTYEVLESEKKNYFCRLYDAFYWCIYFSSFIPNDQYTAAHALPDDAHYRRYIFFFWGTTVYIINMYISKRIWQKGHKHPIKLKRS